MANYTLYKLYLLLCRKFKMNMENKLTINIPTNSMVVKFGQWQTRAYKNKIQVSMNKTLCLEGDADWYTSSQHIRTETNTTRTQEIIDKEDKNLIERMTEHIVQEITKLKAP